MKQLVLIAFFKRNLQVKKKSSGVRLRLLRKLCSTTITTCEISLK